MKLIAAFLIYSITPIGRGEAVAECPGAEPVGRMSESSMPQVSGSSPQPRAYTRGGS
jgi:hypothetical protein